MIEFFLSKKELEKALAQLKRLEERGFNESMASFGLVSTGLSSSDDVAQFNDQFILQADGENWGRISGEMIDWQKYENGEVVET